MGSLWAIDYMVLIEYVMMHVLYFISFKIKCFNVRGKELCLLVLIMFSRDEVDNRSDFVVVIRS